MKDRWIVKRASLTHSHSHAKFVKIFYKWRFDCVKTQGVDLRNSIDLEHKVWRPKSLLICHTYDIMRTHSHKLQDRSFENPLSMQLDRQLFLLVIPKCDIQLWIDRSCGTFNCALSQSWYSIDWFIYEWPTVRLGRNYGSSTMYSPMSLSYTRIPWCSMRRGGSTGTLITVGTLSAVFQWILTDCDTATSQVHTLMTASHPYSSYFSLREWNQTDCIALAAV